MPSLRVAVGRADRGLGRYGVSADFVAAVLQDRHRSVECTGTRGGHRVRRRRDRSLCGAEVAGGFEESPARHVALGPCAKLSLGVLQDLDQRLSIEGSLPERGHTGAYALLQRIEVVVGRELQVTV